MYVDIDERNRLRKEYLGKVYSEIETVDTIYTSSVDGEFRLSSKDVENSPMSSNKLIINDIKTLKSIAGNPNEFYDKNLLEYKYPEVINVQNKNIREDYIKMGYDNKKMVCDIMSAYVYGDSRVVEENEKLLNKIYFPMEIVCFGN